MSPERLAWPDAVNAAAASGRGPDARRRVLQTVARTHPFPLRTVFRGLVVGARTLEAPAGRSATRFLEVVPEGFTRAAYDALGAVLVPTARGLGPGSVVIVAVDVQDPTTYHLEPAGVLADLVRMDVEVAVER